MTDEEHLARSNTKMGLARRVLQAERERAQLHIQNGNLADENVQLAKRVRDQQKSVDAAELLVDSALRTVEAAAEGTRHMLRHDQRRPI